MGQKKQLDFSDAFRVRGASYESNREYERRRREAGEVAVKVWIPEHCRADLHFLCEALRKNPHLVVGPLRDPVTGRLVSLREAVGD